jgi:hypothetical protein
MDESIDLDLMFDGILICLETVRAILLEAISDEL